MKNLNVLSLKVTSPYPALSAVMNALNGSCRLAVLRAAAIIHHPLARRHVQAAPAKTVVLVIEKNSWELNKQVINMYRGECVPCRFWI